MGWEYHDRKRNEDGTFRADGRGRRIGIRVDDMTLGLIRGRAYARGQSMTAYLLDLVRRDHMPVSRGCAPTGGNCGLNSEQTIDLSRAGGAVPRGTAKSQEGQGQHSCPRPPLPLTGARQYN